MRTNILMLCFISLVLCIYSVGAQADNHIMLIDQSVGLDIRQDSLRKARRELTITTKIDVTVEGIKIIASGTKVPYLFISDKPRRDGERVFWELKFIIISITTEYGQVVMINDTIVIRHDENSLTHSHQLELPDTKCTYNHPSKFTLKQGYPFNIEPVQDHILSEFSVGDWMKMRLKDEFRFDGTTYIPRGTLVDACIYYVSPDTVQWGFAEIYHTLKMRCAFSRSLLGLVLMSQPETISGA